MSREWPPAKGLFHAGASHPGASSPRFLYQGENFTPVRNLATVERFSYDLEKWFRYSVRYLFHQPISEKIKTWTLRFPAKENPNMVKALFDWPIVLQYDVKAKCRLISRKFLGMTFFHPSVRLTNQKLTRVCIRSINQSNRSVFIRLFFLFCLRSFI